MDSDVIILKQIKKGEENALHALLKRYQMELYNYVLMLNAKDEDVAAKFQDVFLQSIADARKRGVQQMFQSHLFRKAHLKSGRFRSRVAETSSELEQSLIKIPDRARELIYLRQRAKLRWSQISEVMGSSIKTLKMTLRDGVYQMIPDEESQRSSDSFCRQIHGEVVDFVEAELDDSSRHHFMRHLKRCRSCQQRVSAFRRTLFEIEQIRLAIPPAAARIQVLEDGKEQIERAAKRQRTLYWAGGAAVGAVCAVSVLVVLLPRINFSSGTQGDLQASPQASVRGPDKKSSSSGVLMEKVKDLQLAATTTISSINGTITCESDTEVQPLGTSWVAGVQGRVPLIGVRTTKVDGHRSRHQELSAMLLAGGEVYRVRPVYRNAAGGFGGQDPTLEMGWSQSGVHLMKESGSGGVSGAAHAVAVERARSAANRLAGSHGLGGGGESAGGILMLMAPMALPMTPTLSFLARSAINSCPFIP